MTTKPTRGASTTPVDSPSILSPAPLEPAAVTLATLSTASELSDYLKAERARINDPARVTAGDGLGIIADNTALVDALLGRIYDLAISRSSPPAEAGENSPELTIVATGGYGRKELCPYSDVDVTFVTAREDDDYLNAVIKDMFQLVMDVFLYGANVKVGYAYRNIGDLTPLDHQSQTALLDSRYLRGDPELFKEFRGEFRAQLVPLTADFLFQKFAERKAVLAKFGGDQVYRVEPNIKESAGGLRDIHNAEWITQVRFRVGASRVYPALIERGVLSEADADSLRAARVFLTTARVALHIVSGDARDSLTTEKQEAVAAMLAYPDTTESPAVELFMRDYYTHATLARRIGRRVVTRCLDGEIPLVFGLATSARSLIVEDPRVAAQDSALPLHAAELAQAYSLGWSLSIEDAIQQFLVENPAPTDPQYAGRILTRLLGVTGGVADILERLEFQGVLAWIIPEFAPLMSLIPYDVAHEYTVGAHSLRVVRNIEAVRVSSDPKLIDYRRIAGEVALPEVLMLAGLIHDVGKQWPDRGPHAESGAVAALEIAERLGWDPERRDKLVFLVRYHLWMAEISRLRDLTLDETIREFLRPVPDLDALNMLYLLTYADTNAVGEGVWTDVKGKFLSELYHRSEPILTAAQGEESATPYVPNLTRQRERIRRGLQQHNLPIDLIHEHTRNLPAQYLLNTPLEEMYLHIAMIGRLRETYQPIVDYAHEYGTEFTEMTICAFDDPRPGLLAKITGVLHAHDINVHTAQVFTREASVPIAIDTLWIDFRGRPLTATKKSELQESLRSVLLGKQLVAELLHQRKKPLKDQTLYSAKIDDLASDRFSVLEVSAPDEKGVLYRLTRVISELGWDIHAARLSVWGSRARDAFYITDADGCKVPAADVHRITDKLPMVVFKRRKLSMHVAK